MLKEASLIEVALPPADVPKDTEYVIIIDAGTFFLFHISFLYFAFFVPQDIFCTHFLGSSGSRIYLYSWPISLLSYVPLVESVFDVTQPVSKKITPGNYYLLFGTFFLKIFLIFVRSIFIPKWHSSSEFSR